MRFWTFAAVAVAVALLAGVARAAPSGVRSEEARRISARIGQGDAKCAPGEHTLRLGDGRTALMRVTAGGRGGRKALIVALHGAGGGSRDGLWVFRGAWSEPGIVMVAPASGGRTWSFLHGPDLDLEYVNRSLARAFARCPIDRSRVSIGGFSDGASYALTVGLANGALFRTVMGFSPGGVLAERRVGKPRVFVAHGTNDNVLPIAKTSDVIVRRLRASGYTVIYRKFRGAHEVREGIARAAVRWFLRR